MLLSIAWKNVWRNKKRSFIILTAIALGLGGGIFSSAFMQGMVDQRIKDAIDNEVSHLQMHHPDFMANKELDDTIAAHTTILPILDSSAAIKSYCLRIKTAGMVQSAAVSSGIIIQGIDPERERNVTGLNRFIADTNGSWFSSGKQNSVVIGKKLAEKLKIKLKSKIILSFQSGDGSIAAGAFRVEGIYKTSNGMLDEFHVFVHRSELNKLLGFKAENIHEIALLLKDPTQLEQIKNTLVTRFPNTKTETWKEISPEVAMLTQYTAQTLYIVIVILLLALCFGIINTMMMAVMERTREIGVLMAVGMKKWKIFWMITLESILLSLTGGFLGTLLGALSILITSNTGIDLGSAGGGMEDFGFGAMVYPSLGLEFYIILTILVVLTGLAASILPARRALKLNPVEAIRKI